MDKFNNILILGAGDGTRFWPLEKKTYYSFFNKPLIVHLIEKMTSYANKITVVVNKDDMHILEKLQLNGVQLILQNSKIPGMGGAIDSSKTVIKGDVLILNAEDIFDYRVLSQYFPLIQKQSQIIFLARKIKKYFPGGYFKFNDNRITGIVEKPPSDQTPSDMIKLVADYFCDFSLLLDGLYQVKTDRDDYYERAISILLKQNKTTNHIEYNDYWYSLKYPWHVLSLMKFFLDSLKSNKIEKDVIISDKAVMVPPVHLSSGVRVGDFAKIVGPVYIGKNTLIGDHTMVRQSQIGAHSLIGGYSEVTRSYIGDKVMLHRNYIGDSILGGGVLMGADAITANFRFDQKNIKSKIKETVTDTNLNKLGAIIGEYSKIGVNTTILPGIKIGKNTFIGPGGVIREDIEDGVFVFGTDISENRRRNSEDGNQTI